MLLLFSIRQLNDYLFGKKLFIRFTVRERLSVCLCAFSFGFEGGMWVC